VYSIFVFKFLVFLTLFCWLTSSLYHLVFFIYLNNFTGWKLRSLGATCHCCSFCSSRSSRYIL